MAGTFNARINELIKMVGASKLQGKVVVDQIYAKYQHESLDLTHPRGGGAKFLTKSLVQNHRNILRNIARNTLDGKMEEAMAKGVENISTAVYENAPHEFQDLRNSAHPTVKSGGRIVYDRPPVRKRLSKEQLRAKDRARGRK